MLTHWKFISALYSYSCSCPTRKMLRKLSPVTIVEASDCVLFETFKQEQLQSSYSSLIGAVFVIFRNRNVDSLEVHFCSYFYWCYSTYSTLGSGVDRIDRNWNIFPPLPILKVILTLYILFSCTISVLVRKNSQTESSLTPFG